MNYERMLKRIQASYATGIRGDLDIADFQKLDAVTAHMLISFEPVIGKPHANDIERYFSKMFEGKVQPIMSSLSVKPNCFSIIAKIPSATRPISDSEDKSKMTPVAAGLMYLDNQLGEIWNVQEAEGQKVLAKQSKENIDQIIATRRNRMFVTKSSNVSLASVARANELLTAGCKVQAYLNGEVQIVEIVEASKHGFKVKTEAGKEAVVAKEGIIDLKQMADAAKNEDSALKKYYDQAYGDKRFVADLFKAK